MIYSCLDLSCRAAKLAPVIRENTLPGKGERVAKVNDLAHGFKVTIYSCLDSSGHAKPVCSLHVDTSLELLSHQPNTSPHVNGRFAMSPGKTHCHIEGEDCDNIQGHDIFLSQLFLSIHQTGASHQGKPIASKRGRVAKVNDLVHGFKVMIYSCLDSSGRAAKLAPASQTGASHQGKPIAGERGRVARVNDLAHGFKVTIYSWFDSSCRAVKLAPAAKLAPVIRENPLSGKGGGLPGSMTTCNSSRFQGHGFKATIYSYLDSSCRASKLVPVIREYSGGVLQHHTQL
ncbi:unnamed protein product [Timema podura]|uniref:Uncharacterized protein n=1 Tax=Timema podura TaxID=61482 RepID=A0ABN7PFQ8_TIMPD|nr:unnamed protein product [Timema podura]